MIVIFYPRTWDVAARRWRVDTENSLIVDGYGSHGITVPPGEWAVRESEFDEETRLMYGEGVRLLDEKQWEEWSAR